METPKVLAEAAIRIAADLNADAILLQTETGSNCSWLLDKLKGCGNRRIKLIIATSNQECFMKLGMRSDIGLVKIPVWQAGRTARLGQLVAHSLQQGHVSEGQRLVCLLGDGSPDSTDLIHVWNVTGEEYVTNVLSDETLTAAVELSIELASVGADEKPIGAAFVIGDAKNVLRLSYPLMPDPFQNHHTNIRDKKQWELVKKYACFDGAFIIDSDGTIIAAHRCLNANKRCDIPPGLGTRHHAVGAMTAVTGAKGVTVSQEDGLIRVFEKGRIVAKVNPNSRIVECFKEFT